MIKKSNLGASLALLAGSVYGFNSIIVKMAHNTGITTFDLLFYQFGFAILWFGGRYLVTIKSSYEFKKPNGSLKVVFSNPYNWLGAITTVLTGLFYYSSIQLTDPSIASLGLFQYPWILFILGIIFNKDSIIVKNVLAIILLWVGTIMLIGSSTSNISLMGLIYGVAAGTSFAIYLFSLQKISNHPATKIFIIIIATIIASMFCLYNIEEISIFSKNALIYGFIAALLGQILTFELTVYAAKKIPSTILGALTTTELPVAMVLTWIIWGPSPTIFKLFGLIIMLFAILWLKYDPSQNKIRKKLKNSTVEA